MTVDQPPHTIRKQDVDFAGFNQGGDFTFAEYRMDHHLAPAISARGIIRGAGAGRRACRHSAALIGSPRPAYRATDPRNLSLFTNRRDDMPALLAALKAHLLDPIAAGEGRFFQTCNGWLL